MLNRDTIFAAIDHQISIGGDDLGGFAVMVVRVHGLRQVAIRFGTRSGEEAEIGVIDLIRQAVPAATTVCQSGDETFVVVLPGLQSRNHVLLSVAMLGAIFEHPHQVAQATPPWQAHVVMGVALFPFDGADADALWRNAQRAADEAQRRGIPYAFHDTRNARAYIDYNELRDSIESNQLVNFFQPIWQLGRQPHIVGVEALARWTSRTLGPVSPDDFVTYAEQNDLISSLTRWSIHASLRYAAALPRQDKPCRVAINLSPRALSRGDVADQLLDALNIWGVPPEAVVAEITETALARDLDPIALALRRLYERGVRIAIDDFGVGYASITYLSKFPASELKIDRSLVAHVSSDPRMAKLVESIIGFSHNLGLQTTAEGIEDEATQRRLTEMGCDLGQGYHLGRPEPAADFIARYGAGAARMPQDSP
ncbi:MAG TPA: GGDEF domain-containing phosphodiesterase [Rhodanobacteraceae bacterium]